MISLLTLLDDIATTLDDVALMTKGAVQKTSVLMSDDLAVNAGVVVGVNPDRELPMVKAIFLGSLLNKVYCIGGVLVLLAVYPPIINWIMFLGGLFLSYEGAHKILEKLLHKKDKNLKIEVITEKEKIAGAVRTDLILSIEIIVIAKSTLTGSFLNQTLALVGVGLLASIFIYGLVAVIVKADDFGLYLIKKGKKKVGLAVVNSMPYVMRTLGVVGTLAMLLVGGGIVVHTFHLNYILNEHLQNIVMGFALGLICVGVIELKNKLLST